MEPAGPRDPIETSLFRYLEAMGLGLGERYLVAYSAGPDSCTLLAAAAAIGLPGLAAVYVEHGIRPEREREAELELARRVCARLHLPLTVVRLRPGAVELRARRAGEGVESAARRYRYRAIAGAMARRGATRVLVAHTLDDQLETILMRFLSGSGAGGLRGIPASKGPFLRPFLGLRKADLLAYIAARGLEYSTDSTNASPVYARNRIRLELVPFLDRSFPGWRRAALHTAEKASGDEEALARAAEPLAFFDAGRDRRGKRMATDADALLAAPRALSARAIVEGAGRVLGRDRISARLARAALDCLSGGGLYRGGGLELKREGKLAVISRSLDFPRRGGYFVVIDGPGRVRAGSLVVSAEWVGFGERGIRADAFAFPLVIRSRLPGDALALKRGTKRIDELLPEMGLPSALRGRVPLVEDAAGIVAVLGSAFGAQDRYRLGSVSGAEPEDAFRLALIVKGA
jgi:tRNA(Ile)-lysidine synthase